MILSHIDTDKKALLYKSVVRSQFACCPSVWMFCFRQSNNLIYKLTGRALKLICQCGSAFKVLLEKEQECSINQRNLQILVTQVYKIVNGVAPSIMNSLFEYRLNSYNLRIFQKLCMCKRNIHYRLWRIWCLLFWETTICVWSCKFLRLIFKSKKKSWQSEICSCSNCFPVNIAKFLWTPIFCKISTNGCS